MRTNGGLGDPVARAYKKMAMRPVDAPAPPAAEGAGGSLAWLSAGGAIGGVAAAVALTARWPAIWPLAALLAVAIVAGVLALWRRSMVRHHGSFAGDLHYALHAAGAVVSRCDLDTTWVSGIDGDIEAIMGYSLEEWMSLDHRTLMHPDDIDVYWIDADAVNPGMVVDRVGRLRHAKGHFVWIREVSHVTVDRRGRRTMRGFFFDITSGHEHAAALSTLARTDALTGLPNRLALTERLTAAIDRSEQLALLIIDLDRFKEINDTLGHEAGDQVLVVMSDRLRTVLTPADTLYRLGGDEYAIVVAGAAEPADVDRLLASLATDCARPIAAWGLHLAMSLSTGVAFAQPGSDRATLMRHADIAMYAAKRAGRPYRVFDSSLDDTSTLQLSLSAGLAEAIETGEIELFFQPQFDLRTGAIVGAEGLARWRHPEFGLLEPAAFLAVALMSESTGQFTTHVVGQAIAMIRRTAESGQPLCVAVNVPMGALRDLSFAANVLDALSTAGVAAQLLTIEVTEDDVADPSPDMVTALERLHAGGVRIAIDDFGTGHSSLARLRSLPVSELKIDRAFVERVADDRRDYEIVRAVAGLGAVLDYRVVAEGVERPEQVPVLNELGCHVAQGFLFAAPMPADEFADMLCNGRVVQPATKR